VLPERAERDLGEMRRGNRPVALEESAMAGRKKKAAAFNVRQPFLRSRREPENGAAIDAVGIPFKFVEKRGPTSRRRATAKAPW